MTIKLNRIYHPSYRTNDLEATEEFFRRVFGRHSLPRASLIMAGIIRQPEKYPSDYCTFTPLADVYFDSLDPQKYVWEGRQPYPSTSEPYLDGYGWAVESDMRELAETLRAHGIRLTDQWNNVVEGNEIPSASFKPTALFWTLQEDTGLRYEFYPVTSIQSYDPRALPGWELPDVSRDDPLAIRRSSHHTVLTANITRAKGFFVDVLGGEVVDESFNPAWHSQSTFVRLANDVHELAVIDPDSDVPTAGALRRRLPLDSYHAISFLVADLEKATRHLEASGVGLQWRSRTGIVTDPQTSIGVTWGFYSVPPFYIAG